MDKSIQEKIRSCKALRGKTIFDVVLMPRFRENLAAYWEAQKQDRAQIRASYEAMRKAGGPKGYKIPAHPIDRLIGLSVGDLSAEYMAVVSKSSNRPAAERLYIQQLCQQAYKLTIAQIVCDEFPELESALIPKPTNAN